MTLTDRRDFNKSVEEVRFMVFTSEGDEVSGKVGQAIW
jgi:hypothetical protein